MEVLHLRAARRLPMLSARLEVQAQQQRLKAQCSQAKDFLKPSKHAMISLLSKSTC